MYVYIYIYIYIERERERENAGTEERQERAAAREKATAREREPRVRVRPSLHTRVHVQPLHTRVHVQQQSRPRSKDPQKIPVFFAALQVANRVRDKVALRRMLLSGFGVDDAG
jgi:predicted metalloprotease